MNQALQVDENETFDDQQTVSATKSEPDPKPSEPERAPQKTPDPRALAPVGATSTGLLVGSSLEAQYRLAQYYVKSGLLPASFNTTEKVLVGMQFCFELGLKPLTAMRQIMVINGTPSLWGNLPLALVRRSGELEEFEEFLIASDGKRISSENGNLDVEIGAGVCKLKRKDRTPIERVFTRSDAERAGLFSKTKSLWGIYPKRMFQMRVRGWALNDEFSDILMGAAIGEYEFNASVENGRVVEGSPTNAAKELNDAYAEDATDRRPPPPEGST